VFGTSPKRFWNLVWLNSVAEFKLMYVGSALGSALGYAWGLARPLLIFAIVYIVFSQVLGVGDTVPFYAAMLLLNLSVFFFLADTSDRAIQSLVASEGVLRKMQFPRAAIPLSITLTGLFTFGLNLIAAFGLVLAVGTPPLWTWLLLPLLWFAMLVFVTAVAVMLSTLFVRFRDISQIWTVASAMLFYFSPVMYPVELVPEKFDWLLIVNPVAPIFEQMRVWSVDPSGPTPLEVTGDAWGLVGPLIVFVITCAAAVVLMRQRARTMAEEL
jgi:ABC-2 type transport system permease protein